MRWLINGIPAQTINKDAPSIDVVVGIAPETNE
jgi:hypothetical protein